jgi:hypothetical protein
MSMVFSIASSISTASLASEASAADHADLLSPAEALPPVLESSPSPRGEDTEDDEPFPALGFGGEQPAPIVVQPASPYSQDSSHAEAEEAGKTVFELEAVLEEEGMAGQSDEYKPFFKMLRMGVPKEAVKAKMQAKGLAADVLDLGPDTLMSRVTALERQFEESKRKVVVEPIKKNASKLRMEVIPDALLNKGKSVWANNGQDVVLSYQIMARIDELFINEPAPVVPRLGASKKKQAATTVLEPKRVQGLGIALKKIRISPARLTWALREMNESVLTPSVVEIMLKCNFFPTEEELRLLKRRTELELELMEVDAVLYLIGTSVPDAMTRINALSFKFQYTQSVQDTTEAGDVLKRASVLVCNTASLHRVLRAILEVTNRINEDVGSSRVSGFTLASLLRLGTIKSMTDKSLTVLDFIVQCVADSTEPKILEFCRDLELCVQARRIDLSLQIKAVREYRRGLEAVRRIKQLEDFAFGAMRDLDQLESSMQVVRDFFGNALEYFGYEREAMTSIEFFEAVCAFMQLWTQAVAKYSASADARKRKERQDQMTAARATTKAARADRKHSVLKRPSLTAGALANVVKRATRWGGGKRGNVGDAGKPKHMPLDEDVPIFADNLDPPASGTKTGALAEYLLRMARAAPLRKSGEDGVAAKALRSSHEEAVQVGKMIRASHDKVRQSADEELAIFASGEAPVRKTGVFSGLMGRVAGRRTVVSRVPEPPALPTPVVGQGAAATSGEGGF